MDRLRDYIQKTAAAPVKKVPMKPIVIDTSKYEEARRRKGTAPVRKPTQHLEPPTDGSVMKRPPTVEEEKLENYRDTLKAPKAGSSKAENWAYRADKGFKPLGYTDDDIKKFSAAHQFFKQNSNIDPEQLLREAAYRIPPEVYRKKIQGIPLTWEEKAMIGGRVLLYGGLDPEKRAQALTHARHMQNYKDRVSQTGARSETAQNPWSNIFTPWAPANKGDVLGPTLSQQKRLPTAEAHTEEKPLGFVEKQLSKALPDEILMNSREVQHQASKKQEELLKKAAPIMAVGKWAALLGIPIMALLWMLKGRGSAGGGITKDQMAELLGKMRQGPQQPNMDIYHSRHFRGNR